MRFTLFRFRLFLAIAALVGSGLANAQDYPSRPVTMIVPAGPGGATDIIARVMAEEFSKKLKQPFVVENKTGASGMIGTQAVARAAPDGYTLLLAYSTPIYYTRHMFAKVPYDVTRDLAVLSEVATTSLVLSVHKDVPVRNMKEFMAWAQQGKGKLSYGSYGTGSAGHLMSAYLSQSRDLQMTHVPYKSEGPYVQDLSAGVVPWGIGTFGPMMAHVKSGRIRPLAVMAPKRLAELPDVPTMAEAGFPDPEFHTIAWFTLSAPAGTPRPILDLLEKNAREIAQSTPLKARFQVFGMEGVGGSSEQFRRNFEATSPIIEKLIKVSGARTE